MSRIADGRESIQRRIVNGFFATTTLALLITAGALFSTAVVQFRQDMDESLRVLRNHLDRIMPEPALPAFFVDLSGVEIQRQLKSEGR